LGALAISIGLWPGRSFAERRAELPVPSDEPVPSCLDDSIVDELGQRLRPRGVQKRDFLKQGELQITASGGMLAGDLMSSAYLAGGGLVLWITEDFGVGATAEITRVDLDIDRPLTEFFGDDRFENGRALLGLAGLSWSPIHGKVKIGDSIVHSDIVFSAGAGRLFHDSVQGIAFDGGVSFELLTSSWVTLQFGLRDLLMVQEAVAETQMTHNILATAGLSLWLPTGL